MLWTQIKNVLQVIVNLFSKEFGLKFSLVSQHDVNEDLVQVLRWSVQVCDIRYIISQSIFYKWISQFWQAGLLFLPYLIGVIFNLLIYICFPAAFGALTLENVPAVSDLVVVFILQGCQLAFGKFYTYQSNLVWLIFPILMTSPVGKLALHIVVRAQRPDYSLTKVITSMDWYFNEPAHLKEPSNMRRDGRNSWAHIKSMPLIDNPDLNCLREPSLIWTCFDISSYLFVVQRQLKRDRQWHALTYLHMHTLIRFNSELLYIQYNIFHLSQENNPGFYHSGKLQVILQKSAVNKESNKQT